MNGLNRYDVIRMAREVADIQTDSRGREEFIFDSYGVERFAALVAAAEREACARHYDEEPNRSHYGYHISTYIRSRGQNEMP